MSDFVEGLGTVAEGGLFARAIEPASGAMPPHPHQPANCLNCGTALVGAFCHACGQQGHVHRTIGAIGHDLLHGALHFEGKLWRTLPMLAFRPGSLTRRYIAGQRARFVSPMALFLFSVFLMFAVFQMVGITAPTDLSAAGFGPGMGQVREQAQDQVEEAQADLASLAPDDPARAEAEARVAETQETLAAIERIPALGVNVGTTDVDVTGIPAIDHNLIKKWTDNPGLMVYKLQANAYKFSWLLIPISIPFVWLLFAWRRRFAAYDHAIFVTYSLSFMTLLFVVLSVLGVTALTLPTLATAGAIIVPVHLYKQLRGAYGLSRFSALWRLCVLSIFITIIVVVFVQLLLLVGMY